MNTISIIGTGSFARILAARSLDGGNAVEVIARDAAKAESLAGALGGNVSTAEFGAVPAGDLVILSVPYDSAAPVVSKYGEALAGKVIVDLSNPFNSDATGLATPVGVSAAEQTAEAAPAGARVVKAFNTIFGNVLARGGPLDAFIAGDDAQAKATVSAFIASIGLRPLDVGDLSMARWLEAAALMMMGLGRHGVGNYGFSLGVRLPD